MSVQDTSTRDDDARDDAWFENRPVSTERGPCKRHPSNRSTFTCERCGDFRCEACHRTMGVRDLCPPCHALAARDESASYWAIGAAVLGFWGLGCAPVGWVGMLLGVIALVLSFRNKRPAGRVLAALGVGLGVIGTALFIAAFSMALASELDGSAEPLDPYADPWAP